VRQWARENPSDIGCLQGRVCFGETASCHELALADMSHQRRKSPFGVRVQ
jgi:hypothetical protein